LYFSPVRFFSLGKFTKTKKLGKKNELLKKIGKEDFIKQKIREKLFNCLSFYEKKIYVLDFLG